MARSSPLVVVLIAATACSLETSALLDDDGGVATVDSMAGEGGMDAAADAPVDVSIDAPILDGGACDGGEGSCSAGMASTCVDGTLEVRPCPLGCSTLDPTRCAQLVPSNVASSFDPEASNIDVDDPDTFDTDACSHEDWTTRTEMQTDPSAPEVCVVVVDRLRIRDQLEVTGSRPLVILATGIVEIDAVLDVSAYRRTPGPGGGDGGSEVGERDGGGPSPGLAGEFMSDPADHGGGGGGLCGAGGRGGDAADSYGGDGGARVTGWDLSPLMGGSGGGDGSNTGGRGGAGGGALQISSRVGIRLRGQILAGGGGGQQGIAAADSGAGGGGGSGGAVLLEAPLVEVEAGGFVRATGGGGGGASSQSVGDGRPGQNGADAAASASGGASTMSDSAGDGGDSGGGTTIDGRQGEDVTGNGGGGGGGAGCVVVANLSGALPANLASDSSPSVDPGLRAIRATGD